MLTPKKFYFLVIFLISSILTTFVLSEQHNHIQWEEIEIQREEINKIKEELDNIKKERDSLKETYSSLMKHIKDEEHKDKLAMDLQRVPEDYRDKIVALCWTESRLKYNVVHKGVHDGATKGICGLKDIYWGDLVKENNAEINSLYGGYIVLKFLEDKHGSFRAGLKAYKGAVKDTIQVQKVLDVMSRL